MDFLGIHWASSDNIWFAPILFLLLASVVKNYMRVRSATSHLAHKKLRTTVFSYFSLKKYFTKALLLSVALISLFLAFLQPQWGKKDEKVVQEGRDVLILLDISRSMLAQDLQPNRLELAKLKVKHLLSQLDVDRVGLILFSGTAFLQCPLTRDYSAFSMFLDQVDVETISSGTTAIDTALQTAVKVYSATPERKNKLVLLITDGEDFSLNFSQVKNKAKELNIKLFALGAATTDGAPIPIIDARGNQQGHERDEQGNVVLSKLNEALLKDICQQMNGTFFKARYGDGDIDALVDIIKGFEREKFTDRKITKYEDQYPWFLGFAFVLLLLEWLL